MELHIKGRETRGNRRYYYKAYKVNGRVRKAYVGNGLAAEIAAHPDGQSREMKQNAAERRRLEDEAVRTLDAPVDAFTDTIEILTRAMLVMAGYHRHHGSDWMKRRHA